MSNQRFNEFPNGSRQPIRPDRRGTGHCNSAAGAPITAGLAYGLAYWLAEYQRTGPRHQPRRHYRITGPAIGITA
ncbi:hypothetical protein GCM10007387_54970 [Pseudoduganella albidiflava]|uniref:Uncharacterized protein n=1 Tax=Pseudoduganella albidiflava TaxID=321983 RepID=A0AA88C905_9BURK|nr:hypothetical protein GCM10007387_54970 [Pseudoduganella albidiflava]